MITKTTRTETNEVAVITYICDRCGEEAFESTYRRALEECLICGKNVCRPCRVGFDDYESEEPYVMGDRPYYRACKVCWEIGNDYRLAMREEQDRADETKADIFDRWQNAAKSKKK